MSLRGLLACVGGVALIAAACGSPAAAPDVVVLRWMQAFAAQDGQTVARLTCKANQTDTQNARLLSMAFGSAAPTFGVGGGGGGGGLGGGNTVYDVSNLQYATAFADGQSAQVKVTGFLRVSSGMISQTVAMNSTIPLIHEQDQWRVCDTGHT